MTGWKPTYKLEQIKDDIWSGTFDISFPEKIEYKFIVDGVWIYSKDHPITTDKCGNINNLIES